MILLIVFILTNFYSRFQTKINLFNFTSRLNLIYQFNVVHMLWGNKKSFPVLGQEPAGFGLATAKSLAKEPKVADRYLGTVTGLLCRLYKGFLHHIL